MLEGAKAVPGFVRRQGESRTVLLEQMVRQVHDGGYLDFLQRASESLPRDQTLYDHPYFAHGLDRETGVVRGTYATALSSATQALSTALSVLDGGTAMALCQPPGHHAGRAFLGGYCYLNNAAVTACTLLEAHDHVAIIDLDFHFGNGTADIARGPIWHI